MLVLARAQDVVPTADAPGRQPQKRYIGASSHCLFLTLQYCFLPAQDVVPRHPADNPVVRAVYTQWGGGACMSPEAVGLLHTSYRKREKTVASAVSDW